MLLARTVGACPKCKGKNGFGNVLITDRILLRGCILCGYKQRLLLPEIRKKILYLDQFFFSHAFRGGDKRFIEAANEIRKISALQLLVVPYSSIHEDETHQWTGYDDKNHKDLMEFIKATSRGFEFDPSYEVEENQIFVAFKSFLSKTSEEFKIEESQVFRDNIHEWDNYFRIDVDHYIGDVDLIRSLKKQCVEGLVGLFDAWRLSNNSFEQDFRLELNAAGKGYIDAYAQYMSRIAAGDYNAVIDAPIISQVVSSMLEYCPDEMDYDQKIKQIMYFFTSEHFRNIPYQWLSARIYAVLKHMVKNGAYKKRETAIKKLNGLAYDVRHISMYAPYCDAFIMDKPMATIVSDPRISLEKKYGVKIFSLNNWEELLKWLQELEENMSDEHKQAIHTAYP